MWMVIVSVPKTRESVRMVKVVASMEELVEMMLIREREKEEMWMREMATREPMPKSKV